MTQDSILVTTDAVGLYRSITHNADLEALKDVPDCRQNKKIPIDMLVQMAKFVLTLTTLSFGKKYCVKKRLLVRNFHHVIRASLWISFRQIFLKLINCNHLFG